MDVKQLIPAIDSRTVKVGQIGLGYVGLPVACLIAQAGFSTIGVDLDTRKIDLVSRGISPIEGIEPGLSELVTEVIAAGRLLVTTDYTQLAGARIILIAVDTPVQNDTHKPLYNALRGALHALGAVLGTGALVIVESTIAPGTVSKIVIPILEEMSGKEAGVDFWVGHCPERVMPGRLLRNLRTLDRVVGGMTPDVGEVMAAFYRSYMQGQLDLADPLTAELVKTGENAYRDVNIAFANEMALICDELGADIWKVRDLINKSPGRVMLMPGAGVGGHCIPKDPWLLASSVEDAFDTPLIKTARHVNDAMPAHMLGWIVEALTDLGLGWSNAKIVVLGYAYLENSDDVRNSPTASLVAQLETKGADFVTHDPFVSPYQTDLTAALQDASIVVGMVKHDTYASLDFTGVLAVIDGRGIWSKVALQAQGTRIYGVPRQL